MSREEFIMPDERLLPEFTADGHLEEGTVHAWLDDAFDVDATALVAAHVGGCASCAALVAEARGLMAGSSRILAALDVAPAGVVPAADAARTAARIADAVPLNTRTRNVGTRRGSRPWWYSAAAAAVLVLGLGSTVWLRGGKELANDTTEGASAQAAKKAEEPAVAPSATPPVATPIATPVAPPVASSESPAVARLVVPAPAPALAARAPLTMPSATAMPVAADVGTADAAPRRVVVTGTVVDASTSQAIDQVQVDISAAQGTIRGATPMTRSAVTNILGRFSVTFDGLAPNTVLTIRARRIGYDIATLTHSVLSDTVQVSMRLPHAALALSEVVTNTAAPEPRRKETASATVATTAAPPPAAAPSPTRGVAGASPRYRDDRRAARRDVTADADGTPPRPPSRVRRVPIPASPATASSTTASRTIRSSAWATIPSPRSPSTWTGPRTATCVVSCSVGSVRPPMPCVSRS